MCKNFFEIRGSHTPGVKNTETVIRGEAADSRTTKKTMNEKHTFVICAYGESPYLEACIRSLKNQTVKSRILMATSTPNSHIRELGKKHHIPLFINEGEAGIVEDWNFGYRQADTRYITIAHQDDIYHSSYTCFLCKMMEEADRPLIFFSDYGEIRNKKIVRSNTLLRIKRLMLLPLECQALSGSKFVRRRILSLGSPICCPSVGFAREQVKTPIFQPGFRSNEDWQAWEKISREKGDFVYCRKRLVYHRIHEESATTSIIGDSGRMEEDLVMFRKFWPAWIAEPLARMYGKSEESNNM